MRSFFLLFGILYIASGLTGCVAVGPSLKPYDPATPSPISTIFPLPTHPTDVLSVTTALTSPSPSPVPSSTPTITPVPSPTLEPKHARDLIDEKLLAPEDCTAPCFLGIVPGRTTLDEARNILSYLGQELKGPTSEKKGLRYGAFIETSNGSVLLSFLVANQTIRSLRVVFSSYDSNLSVLEWVGYSPAWMVQNFGTPSRVDLHLGRGAYRTPLTMDLYFETTNVTIEYYIDNLGRNVFICPMRDKIDKIYLWIGENPLNPPLPGEPLEKTTSLDLEQFSQLMLERPEDACFTLIVENFP